VRTAAFITSTAAAVEEDWDVIVESLAAAYGTCTLYINHSQDFPLKSGPRKENNTGQIPPATGTILPAVGIVSSAP
jgi:hypothetical protein